MSEHPVALAGVKVVSFGAFVAGNTAAKLLAELGADVIKIEPRARPEVLRTPIFAIGAAVTEPSGAPNTVMYATLVRGLRSLSIDLANDDTRPLFHRLVAAADIVVENFGGDVLGRFGCGYEDLLVDNPDLVMLSLSGYGRSGPRAGYLGYASSMAAYLGLSSAWGFSHGILTDYVTGVTGAAAAVAALGQARTTGLPAYLDVAQIDAMAPVLAALYADPLNNARDDPPPPNQVLGSWLSGVYPGRGHDVWLAIDLEDGDDWNTLCQVLDRHDLTAIDEAHADTLQDQLSEAFGTWALQYSVHQVIHVLQKAGLAAAVVQDSEDIWRDPQLRVRGFGEQISQPDLGEVTYPTSAQRWTATPGAVHQPPPRLGQHTNEILREWVDLSDEEIEHLAAEGAIFDAS